MRLPFFVVAFLFGVTIAGESVVFSQVQYKIQVSVKTRAGEIPVRNVVVTLDQVELGRTGDDGLSPTSSASTRT